MKLEWRRETFTLPPNLLLMDGGGIDVFAPDEKIIRVKIGSNERQTGRAREAPETWLFVLGVAVKKTLGW
jgi:hypothetical protein